MKNLAWHRNLNNEPAPTKSCKLKTYAKRIRRLFACCSPWLSRFSRQVALFRACSDLDETLKRFSSSFSTYIKAKCFPHILINLFPPDHSLSTFRAHCGPSRGFSNCCSPKDKNSNEFTSRQNKQKMERGAYVTAEL